MIKKIVIQMTASLLITVGMSGCGVKPTYMDLTLKSSKNINPDNNNISSPLMLNFYELDSAEQFSKLDYWTLVDNSKDKLNSDLISQTKNVIIPNQEQIYKILFDKKARFLGIIANFRNLDANATWRYVIDLKKDTHNVVDLKIDGNKIKEED